MSSKQAPTFWEIVRNQLGKRVTVKTYEGIGVVTKEQIYPLCCLFNCHNANSSFAVTVLHAWMS